MSRSVYSVILNDELVAELDKVAYENGVSRSFMLDKILADYLTVETPTLRMENIFSRMETLIGDWSGLRFINQPSASMAYVQSALVYRYNPTVKYSVELFNSDEDLGAIKISLRTQNPTLIGLMEGFYSFFISLESKYLGERKYAYDGLKFSRILKKPQGLSAEELGDEIAYFVRSTNFLLNTYFTGLNNPETTKSALEKKYGEEIAEKIHV